MPAEVPTSDTAISTVVVTAFVTSMVGDWFFDSQWTNPWWYGFEAAVVGTMLMLVHTIARSAENSPQGKLQ